MLSLTLTRCTKNIAQQLQTALSHANVITVNQLHLTRCPTLGQCMSIAGDPRLLCNQWCSLVHSSGSTLGFFSPLTTSYPSVWQLLLLQNNTEINLPCSVMHYVCIHIKVRSQENIYAWSKRKYIVSSARYLVQSIVIKSWALNKSQAEVKFVKIK